MPQRAAYERFAVLTDLRGDGRSAAAVAQARRRLDVYNLRPDALFSR
jgi:hypothetical protein